MGYQSDVRSFNTRYIYTDSNQRKNWHNATGSTVIAAHEGQSRQQIIIMAHLDTYAPQSDKDVENNLGGLTLQGNTESEKAVESRLEEGCYYLLFDSRSPLGANEAVRRWLSYLFQPANLLYHAFRQRRVIQRIRFFPAVFIRPVEELQHFSGLLRLVSRLMHQNEGG